MHIPVVAILIAAFSVADNYTPDIVELLNTETTRWNGWIKNTGKYDGWRTQNIPPNGQLVYGLCAMEGGSHDNWLRSPYIQRKEALSTKVEITFTMRSCKARPAQGLNCEDTFSLMIYEADDPADTPGLWNDRIYSTVAVVSPDIRWTDPRQEDNILNVKTYSMEPKRAGFFISLHDVGACAMVKQIRVFYLACAAIIRLFTHYPRTVVHHEYRIRDVKSQCVPGAELIDLKKLPHLLCQPNGYWHYLDTPFCHCKSGFTPSDDNTHCLKCPINTYKASGGPGRCLNCPSDSFSESGSVKCTCNNTMVPVESSGGKLSCSGLLPSPQDLKASFMPDGQLQLEWNKPKPSLIFKEALSSKINFKVGCQSCKESEKLHFSPGSVTTHISVLIDALESGKMYNFSVTSLSYINQVVQSPIPSSSSAIISIITKPADKSYRIPKLVIRKIKGKYSLLVSWSSPTGVTPISYQIVIHGIAINPDISKPVILDPILKISKTLQCQFPYLMNLVYAYRIKVRARSTTNWGPFSDEQEINLNHMTDNGLNESEFEESKNDILSPGRLSMISIFGMGLILMVIAIPLCFYCRYIASKSFGIHNKKDFKRTLSIPLDIANYSQIQTGSTTTKIYIDPSNYQDPSTLIKEFAHEIDPGKVNIECVIGEGEFGEVCKGRLSKRGNPSRIAVAIKTLKSNLSEKDRVNFFIEAATMAQFNHPNIIKLIGVVTKTHPIMILTQFIEFGSLDIFLQKNKYQFSTLQLLGILRGIASGMKYLSDMHYVHRDLAARNILVDKDLCCKVSDFGLSREIGADTTEGAYTTKGGLIPVRWTAPEAINYRRFTSSSDVWSFGIVMWEVMSYGDRPYWDWANKDVLQSIEAGYRLPAPKGCPPPIHLLMLDCWIYERAGRPKFQQILHSIDALQQYPESLSTLPFSLSLRRSIPLDLHKSHQSIISLSKNNNDNSKPLLQPKPVFSSQSTIFEWLEWLDLGRYQNIFSNRNLVYLGQILKFTRQELLSLDISDSDHLYKIVKNIEAMQNHFEDVQTPSFAS